MRLFYIFKNHYENLSFKNFIATIITALFRNDIILVYAIDIKNFDLPPVDSVDGVVIRKGKIEDFDRVSDKLDFVPWEFSCHKFDGVKDFFVAIDNNWIQSITWIYYKDDHNRILSLGENDVLLLYSLTLPQFRGHGLYPKILKASAAYLINNGYKRIFGLVEINNSSSIRGLEKAGYKIVGKTHLRKFFGIQISSRFDTSKI